MSGIKPHIVAKIRHMLTEVALYDLTHADDTDGNIGDLFHLV